VLVDGPAIKAQLAPLYRQAMARLAGGQMADLAQQLPINPQLARTRRSGLHLAEHFADVPLLLLGFGRSRDGSGIYPALWSAILAARAEGIGATLTGMLQSYFSDEVFGILGVPKDAGWYQHGVVVLGYPLGTWGWGRANPSTRSPPAMGGRASWGSPWRSRCGRNSADQARNRGESRL
jgi:hypothetical protein